MRGDEGVRPDQDLVLWQGGQEEAQSLHQPHALAALHTDAPNTHTHMTRGEAYLQLFGAINQLSAHLVDIFQQRVLQRDTRVFGSQNEF